MSEQNWIAQQYSKSDYELIEREPCFHGFFKMDRFHFRHKKFNGGWTGVVGREVFVRGDATCLIPYDPVAQKVVLLEQFRVGAVLEDQNPWLIELVAGINDKDETPEALAHREAKEEAGLELISLEPICKYLVSPGGTTEKIHLFCAQVDSTGIGGIFGLDEEDEDIKVHVVAVEDAFAMLKSGLINNAPAIIALQWLELNKDRLDEQWGT